MHDIFGKHSCKDLRKCKECSNLIKKQYSKNYYKCLVYGDTNSTATDWRLSYVACGQFNKEYKGNKIIDILKHSPKAKESFNVKGQLTLKDLMAGD